jgi:SAM-dependent methyltransferase
VAAAVLLVENRPMTKPWMLDELAHAGPEHLDPAFVAGYERKQGFPDPAEDLAVLAAHGLDQTSTVVDLGAGTGRFALAAASRFGRVTAVDVSPAMLAVAPASRRGRRGEPRVRAGRVPELPVFRKRAPAFRPELNCGRGVGAAARCRP